ncbi:MAG: flavin reductase family protein [Pseudomonadota bacterium]
MRRYPASVALIATGEAPNRNGMTATAVCSLTATPPQMLVCMNAKSGTLLALQKNKCFSINVLQKEQCDLAGRFSSGDPKLCGDAKFEPSRWRQHSKGAPILSDTSQSFVCRLNTCFEVGTHMIVVGFVLAVINETQEPALLYEDGKFGAFEPETMLQSA